MRYNACTSNGTAKQYGNPLGVADIWLAYASSRMDMPGVVCSWSAAHASNRSAAHASNRMELSTIACASWGGDVVRSCCASSLYGTMAFDL